jgi:hypothetical protein
MIMSVEYLLQIIKLNSLRVALLAMQVRNKKARFLKTGKI